MPCSACAASTTPRGATAFEKAVQNDTWVCANNVLDKSKFEKFYKKVHTSIDNFFYLCYTNMNYYVKLRLIDGIERRKAAEGR